MNSTINKIKGFHKNLINKTGFSLVELVVIVAIMAVLLAVLSPSIWNYVEKSRAQKDDSGMDEWTNAIQIALSDSDVYDEILTFSVKDNVSCYVDTNDENNYEKIITKKKTAVSINILFHLMQDY